MQVYEAKVSQSPESHGSPSSPTFKARWATNARAPKGAKLCHEDFWPNCINPTEPNLSNVEFETFEWATFTPFRFLLVTDSHLVDHFGLEIADEINGITRYSMIWVDRQ